MSNSTLLFALWSLGLMAGPLVAATPPTRPTSTAAAPVSATTERLIEQLGSGDFRKRDEAERQLEARGAAIMAALKKAWDHPDAEARRRIRELYTRLENASFVAPRRVTLRKTNQPLRAILDDIQKQTGYKIEFWTTPNLVNRTYSCDFRDEPFWPVIDSLCRDANLVVQQSYGSDQVTLQNQGGHTPHVQHQGAFRFVPSGFQSYRNLQFGLVGGGASGPERDETLTLSFLVFSEPRIPILGLGEVRLSAAYDSDKNSMLAPAGNPEQEVMMARRMGGGLVMRQRMMVTRYGNGNRSYMQTGQLQLHRPSEHASKVKLLRGTIPVTLLIEEKQVVVADNILKAKGKKNTIGTTSFHIQEVTVQPNKQVALKLSITEDNKDHPNDWSWMNSIMSRIELQDDKGTKFQPYGTSWSNSAMNHIEATLTYGAPPNGKIGSPSKFVFHQWKTLQHQVEFEFKDLPLP